MRQAILFLSALLFLLPQPAHAQSAATAPAPGHNGDQSPPVVHPKPPPASPAQRKVMALAQQLARELNDSQVSVLAGIRVNFGMMRAVESANKDVAQAIDSCDRANPPLQKALDARLGRWQASINPALATQNKNLGLAIDAGVAGDPNKVKAYLDALDNAAAEADGHLLKKPVTSAAACQGLLKSMDRTQKTLLDALAQLQWPPLPAKTAKP